MRVTSMPARNLQEKVSVLLHEKFEHVKHDLENSTELFLDQIDSKGCGPRI